jgi:GTP-binding protein
MIIKEAEFLMSNSDVKKCPSTSLPEYAFIGRSNVGKSSLINMLVNRKQLAMISSKPGKTRLINHFIINKSWHLVDLPGYGYTRTGTSSRKTFGKIISDYVLKRAQLTSLFVLIDSRLEPQKIDIEFINWVGENGIPFSIIFTKSDKQSQSKTINSINRFKETLLETWEELPVIFVSSSIDKRGREEILEYIDLINKEIASTENNISPMH